MSNINQLSEIDSISTADLLVIWNTANGCTRKASMGAVLTYLQAQITADDDQQTQYASPNATGFSVQIAPAVDGNDVWLLLTPLAGYAAGTIVLPPVAQCIDQQEVLVSSTQAVTTLTTSGNGATINGAPTTLAANGFFKLKFNLISSSWHRVG